MGGQALTRDSYNEFFKIFGNCPDDEIIRKFLLFGLENTMFVHPDSAKKQFESICNFVFHHESHSSWKAKGNRNTLYIRKEDNEGRSKSILEAYQNLYGLDTCIKLTDNTPPRTLIRAFTDKSDKNYQCSHVFERSLNILAYMSVWNFALTPKIIDPLTGHETKGEMPVLYQTLFQGVAKIIYADCIDLYNQSMKKLRADANNKNIYGFDEQWKDICNVEFSNPSVAEQTISKFMDVSGGIDKIKIADAYEAVCRKYLMKDPQFRTIGFQYDKSLDCSDIEKDQKEWLTVHPEIVMLRFDAI